MAEGREGRKGMGQLARRKKGRPSKRDLSRRRTVAGDTAAAPRLRRSLRRRRCLRYTLDSDEFREDDDEYDDDDDDDDEIIREKKLKLVLNLPTFTKSDKINTSAAASVFHAPSLSAVSTTSSSSSENTAPKRRRIDRGGGVSRNGGEQEEEEAEDEEEEEECSRYKPTTTRGNKAAAAAAGSHSSSHLPLPHNNSLHLILDKLQKKDVYGVYADPVDPEELPDYHDIIEHPMDFATVRNKLENGSYSVLKEFESDVYLICSNAMQYNTSDTIYHKQARAIQELARKKFERLKIDIQLFEKEKTSQKVILNSSVNKKMCKPACFAFKEAVGSDFSSGATLATAGGDTQNAFNTCHTSFDRHNRVNMTVEGNSSRIDSNYEKAYELQSGKGLVQSKFGRRPESTADNPRSTYDVSDTPPREETVFSTFEAEPKQLVAVGLHAEHSYARSLSLFSATLGSEAWRASADRIRQVLPPRIKFGRGWVGEYELPLSSLIIPGPPPQPPSQDPSNKGPIPISFTDKPPLNNAEISKRMLSNNHLKKQQQQFTNGMVTPGHDQSAGYNRRRYQTNGMVTPGGCNPSEYGNPRPPNVIVTSGHDRSVGYSEQQQQPVTMVTPGHDRSTGYDNHKPQTNGTATPGRTGYSEFQLPNEIVTPGRTGYSEFQPPNEIVTPGHDPTTRCDKHKPRSNGMATPGHVQSVGYSKPMPSNATETPVRDQSIGYGKHKPRTNGMATSGQDHSTGHGRHPASGTVTPGHDDPTGPNRGRGFFEGVVAFGNEGSTRHNRRRPKSSNGMTTPGDDTSTVYGGLFPNRTATPGDNRYGGRHLPNGIAPAHDDPTEYNRRQRVETFRDEGPTRHYGPPKSSDGTTTPGDDTTAGYPDRPPNRAATPGDDRLGEYGGPHPPNAIATPPNKKRIDHPSPGIWKHPPNGTMTPGPEFFDPLRRPHPAADIIGRDMAAEMPTSRISARSLYNPARPLLAERSTQPSSSTYSYSPSLIFEQTGDANISRCEPAVAPGGNGQKWGEERGRMSPPDLNIGYQPDLALQL